LVEYVGEGGLGRVGKGGLTTKKGMVRVNKGHGTKGGGCGGVGRGNN